MWNTLTPEQKYELIRSLIMDERLSYSLIARRLNISRGTVAGAVVRARGRGIDITPPADNLLPRPGAPVAARPARRVPRAQSRNPRQVNPRKPSGVRPDFNYKPQLVAEETLAPSPPPRADAFTPLPGSQPATLEQRLGCAWPVGENPTLFCNEPRKLGSSWCRHHHAIGYIAAPKRPPSPAATGRSTITPARMTVLAADWDR